jgi:hypothetical protein
MIVGVGRGGPNNYAYVSKCKNDKITVRKKEN